MKSNFVLNPDFNLKKTQTHNESLESISVSGIHQNFNYQRYINRQMPKEHVKKLENVRLMQLE